MYVSFAMRKKTLILKDDVFLDNDLSELSDKELMMLFDYKPDYDDIILSKMDDENYLKRRPRREKPCDRKRMYNCPTSYTGFDAQDWFAERFKGKAQKPVPKNYRCCLCGKPFQGYGNNPAPLTNDDRMRCCDDCNITKVIPARLQNYLINKAK